ncbi:uncharacterized protein LOC123267075 [Cotesia glomerata]|uniref:uncharacterized protein LOC123267075 n=1 Tax=Cotesia glomerata TaxID=32391 RepID=UPI001D00415E|nr:uncharacterized protein LOC123267075 [Cotesia glomerata]
MNIENCYRTALCSKILLRESVVEDITCVNYAIMELCDICDQIADFYAIPTLMIIHYFITRITFEAYYIFVTQILLNKLESLKFCVIISIICLTIVSSLVVFTSNITRITREFSKTSHYVSMLSKRCATNSTTKEALLDCLRDISQRNVIFSTYGVVTLDNSLLRMIFGAIVTNLIIFVQFHKQ